MKNVCSVCLAVFAMIMSVATSAQDIIYTLSAEFEGERTSIDSFSVENHTNGSVFGVGNIGFRDEYRVNITNQTYLDETSVTPFKFKDGFNVLGINPGQFRIAYHNSNNVETRISIYNTNGQKMFFSPKYIIENGDILEIKIGLIGIYAVVLESNLGIKTYKAVGNPGTNNIDVILSGNNEIIPFKNGVFDDMTFSVGDNVEVFVFKDSFYAESKNLIVSGDENIVFQFEETTSPEVITLPADSITSESAIMLGEVSFNGYSDIMQRGFYLSELNEDPDLSDSILVIEDNDSSFRFRIKDIKPDTRYYYTAFATNNVGTSKGDVKSFITQPKELLPTVLTLSADSITSKSAILKGEETFDGNAEILEKGFYWSQTDVEFEEEAYKVEVDDTSKIFTYYLSELIADSICYYQAYIINSVGIAKGEKEYFRTEKEINTPTVITEEVTSVTTNEATLHGDVIADNNSSILECGFYWSQTNTEPNESDEKIVLPGSTGAFSSLLSNLEPNAVYYVRAFASNVKGVSMGNVKSFNTTIQKSSPEVETNDASSIKQNSAIVNGVVVFNGNDDIIERGFYWSQTNENPGETDKKVLVSGTTGEFSFQLTELQTGVTCYVRAFATNSLATVYGNQVTFEPASTNNVTYGSYTDSRDEKVYKTVNIGEQTWMAENLAYLPKVSPVSDGSETVKHYYVYDYEGTDVQEAKSTDNYDKYGVLYNWPALIQGGRSSNKNPSGVRGVCPADWHLPSDSEWKQLEMYLGMTQCQADSMLCRGDVATAKLKSETGWEYDSNGINSSGFSAIPGGSRGNGYFSGEGTTSSFATCTSYNEWYFYNRYLSTNTCVSRNSTNLHDKGLSVRCVKDVSDGAMVPTVKTLNILYAQQIRAGINVEVVSDGGAEIENRGVCWNMSGDPTIEDHKTIDEESVKGIFMGSLTGLEPGRIYYVRAFATNSAGTGYGAQVKLITEVKGANGIVHGKFVDPRDNKTYQTVAVGGQTWMAENLAYLPKVNRKSYNSDYEKCYYVYGYDGTKIYEAKATKNYEIYGVLYNWPAAVNGESGSDENPSDVQGACPVGWHLPSMEEWKQFESYLSNNGFNYDGSFSDNKDKLAKSLSSQRYWEKRDWDTGDIGFEREKNNKSGFSGLPAGKYNDGKFSSIKNETYWWSATDFYDIFGLYVELSIMNGIFHHREYKQAGLSIRCVKD